MAHILQVHFSNCIFAVFLENSALLKTRPESGRVALEIKQFETRIAFAEVKCNPLGDHASLRC